MQCRTISNFVAFVDEVISIAWETKILGIRFWFVDYLMNCVVK
jgi:hypothetical protein